MLAVVAVGVISSCGGSDKVAQVDAEAEVAHPDLATFQLNGAVRSVTYNDDYYFENRTFKFSVDGMLECDSLVEVERDSIDRIKMLLFPYKSDTGIDLKYVVIFRYDEKGRVSAIREEDHGWSSRARLTYDEKGFVSVDSTKSPEGLSVTTYSDIKVDDKGNWLSREYVSRNEGKTDSLSQEKGTESRVIAYY